MTLIWCWHETASHTPTAYGSHGRGVGPQPLLFANAPGMFLILTTFPNKSINQVPNHCEVTREIFRTALRLRTHSLHLTLLPTVGEDHTTCSTSALIQQNCKIQYLCQWHHTKLYADDICVDDFCVVVVLCCGVVVFWLAKFRRILSK